MNNTYLDLVKQTFNFPQEGLEVEDGNFYFNGIDMKALIAKYGTPMKLTYLPKIGFQIKKLRTYLPLQLRNTSTRENIIIVIVLKAHISVSL